MSFQTVAWALKLRGVSPLAKLIAIIASDVALEDYSTRPVSIEELAINVCSDEEAVLKAAWELADNCAVHVQLTDNNELQFTFPLQRPEQGLRAPDTSLLMLYVMSCGGRTKVGITAHLENRRLTLQTYSPVPVVLEWHAVGPALLIRRAERTVHAALKEQRIHGEWFDVHVETAIEKAREHAGFGERAK